MTHDRTAGEAAEHSHSGSVGRPAACADRSRRGRRPGVGARRRRRDAPRTTVRSTPCSGRRATRPCRPCSGARRSPARVSCRPAAVRRSTRNPLRPTWRPNSDPTSPAYGFTRGPRPTNAAKSVGATAYTVGTDVVVSAGRYAPGTGEGRRLLAHELTHVRQQQQGPVSGTDRGDGVQVSDPSDLFEQEASRTAEDIAARPTPGPPAGGSAATPAAPRPGIRSPAPGRSSRPIRSSRPSPRRSTSASARRQRSRRRPPARAS